MYPVKAPFLLRKMFPGLLWNLPKEENNIYLTFDDGPHPQVTPWVLDTLKGFQAKASFFVLGLNAEQYPELIQRIKKEGHLVGYHGYHHLDGWKTSPKNYVDNANFGKEVANANMFRPPYGRISPKQIRQLKSERKIVMWDLIPGDFDSKISSEECLKRSLLAKAGSLIVFHDSLKAQKHLEYTLPAFLKQKIDEGYSFPTLPH